jgi:hypothetical protein
MLLDIPFTDRSLGEPGESMAKPFTLRMNEQNWRALTTSNTSGKDGLPQGRLPPCRHRSGI